MPETHRPEHALHAAHGRDEREDDVDGEWLVEARHDVAPHGVKLLRRYDNWVGPAGTPSKR